MTCLSLNYDGCFIGVGTLSGSVIIYDIRNGQQLCEKKIYNDHTNYIEFRRYNDKDMSKSSSVSGIYKYTISFLCVI